MDKEMLRALTQARDKKQLMALYRDALSQCADYTGIPVLVGRQLAVLAREQDFALDGYAALRLEDVTFLEQVDDLPLIQRIAAGERLYENAKPPRLAGGDSWRALLDGVQAGFGGWLTVESADEDGCCFYMGVISRLDENYLYIHCVDPDGTRHQEETTVPMQDIVTVAFGGRYVELYRKYMR